MLIRDVPEILEALRGMDLSSLQTGMDNIRGVNTCALAGVTPHELFNAAPYGEESTQTFLGNREYTDLPRKLNVTITGCLENCTHSETQDIAMTPAIGPKGVYGFNVAVGGQLYDELAKSMLMMVIEDQPGGGGGADHPGRGVHRFPRRRQDIRIGRRCCLHLADRAKRPLKAAESQADCQRPAHRNTSGPPHIRNSSQPHPPRQTPTRNHEQHSHQVSRHGWL